MWLIKAFTADYENTVVSEWFHGQSEAVQVAFETRLNFLKVRPPSIWQRPYVGTLRKECKGLFEIRFEVANVQHRPIGYYPGQLQFTILAFATERDSKLVPEGVCALAKRRQTLKNKIGDTLVSLRSKTNLVQKLSSNKLYRDAYVFEHVRNGLAFQLRGMRDELGWSQAKMGQEVGKPQNVISRLEDPNYGRPNLQTLLEIASGLGVGLLVKFVPFSRLVKEYEDVSPIALSAKPIADKEEIQALEQWAAEPRQARQRTTAHTLRLVDTPPIASTKIQPRLPFSPELRLVPSPSHETPMRSPQALGTNQGTVSLHWQAPIALRG